MTPENFFEDYITAPKGSDLYMKNFDGFIGTTKYGSEKTVQYNIPYHKKWQELVFLCRFCLSGPKKKVYIVRSFKHGKCDDVKFNGRLVDHLWVLTM